MAEQPAPWQPTLRKRLIVVACVFVAWTIGIEGRLVVLQVVRHAELPLHSRHDAHVGLMRHEMRDVVEHQTGARERLLRSARHELDRTREDCPSVPHLHQGRLARKAVDKRASAASGRNLDQLVGRSV